MLDQTTGLPARPGVGYKPQHFSAIQVDAGPVGWLEIHAENYLGAGGRPLAQVRFLAERVPISVHGVGPSIGGAAPPALVVVLYVNVIITTYRKEELLQA